MLRNLVFPIRPGQTHDDFTLERPVRAEVFPQQPFPLEPRLLQHPYRGVISGKTVRIRAAEGIFLKAPLYRKPDGFGGVAVRLAMH